MFTRSASESALISRTRPPFDRSAHRIPGSPIEPAHFQEEADHAAKNLQPDKGGHFGAWEQPELFSAELRAAFRTLR